MLNGNGSSCGFALPWTAGSVLDVRKQIADVVEPHALVRRVGKRRVEMRAVGRRALHHRGDEIGLAPLADAVVSDRARCSAHRTCRTATSARSRRRASSCRPGPAWRGTRRSRPRRTWSGRSRDWAERCGSALAGTVAGMVRPQNTKRPITAAITAKIKSFRSIGLSSTAILGNARPPKSRRAAHPRTRRPVMSRLAETAAGQPVRIAACDRAGGSRRSSCRPHPSAP